MTHHPEPACVADDEGRRCHRDAMMLRPVALCHAHGIEVATAVVPELLRDQLAAALRGGATAPAVRTELVATARATDPGKLLGGVHESVVYFIANGGRVKIGYTTNLKSRLGSLALRSDAVLLVLRGGPDLERALHAHFAEHRCGTTEWFELAPPVFRFIASPHPAQPAATRSGTAPGNDGGPALQDLLDHARQLNVQALAETGRSVSIRRLQRKLRIGQDKATALQRRLIDDAQETS